MREICTSGSVGGEGGNILAYPASSSYETQHLATRTMLGLAKALDPTYESF